MTTINCKLCLENVEERNWPLHIAKKRHQDNLPSKIFVKGVFDGSRIAEIHQYFEQFGKLTKKEVVQSDGSVIVVEYCYENPNSYDTVVHKDHNFCAQKWEVSWCKDLCSEETKINENFSFLDLKTAINPLLAWTRCSFSEQIDILKWYLQSVKPKFETAKKTIREDLCVIFSQIPGFDSSKIQFFGSTEMNLAIPGSNVDVHIQDILEDTVLGLLTSNEHFVDAQKISEGFPRIRCRHVATNLICHLKMGDKLVIKNGELIKYYIGLDEKIYSLLLVIKIWAKYHDLLTQSSSYSFYLLVIFFLQQAPFNLPNVVNLRKQLPPDWEGGWNCAFRPIHWFSAAFHKHSITNLVIGFFKFYENFDYISCIVAPFSGKAHEKTCFLKPYRLLPCYQNYQARSCTLKLDCGLCIQDPFEHSRNVSWEPSLKSSGNFTMCCRYSVNLCKGPFPKLHGLLNRKFSERVFLIKKPLSSTRKQWRADVKNATQNVLCGILTYQLQAKNKEDFGSFSCTKRHDVWTQRIEVWRDLTLTKADVQQNIEFNISNILKNLPGNNLKPDPVSIRIDFHRKVKGVQFCVSGDNEDGTHMDHFLRLKLGRYFNRVPGPGLHQKPKCTAKKGFGAPFHKTSGVKYNKNGDFTQQLEAVFANFPHNNLQLRLARDETLRDLSAGLMPLIPAMQMHVYGSTVTNLQLPAGSIDVCIESGAISDDFFVAFKDIGKFHSAVCNSIESRTLKYTHIGNELTCVVTMGCKKRVKSDRLIQYYLSQDEKVWQLILILKHWSSCHMKRYCSYALYMLVIFYLQQEPYKLPAVADLQRGVPPDYEQGWNYAFVPLAVSSISLKNATILELVEGFFKFYESLDHISYVLSPYTGNLIAKIDFLRPYNLPASYQDFMIKQTDLVVTNDMCLQDPFDHSQNLVMKFGISWGSYLAALCRKALPFMRKESQLYNICCMPLSSLFGIFRLEKPEGYDDEEFASCVRKVFQEIVTSVFQGQYNTDCGIFKYGDNWKNSESILKNLLPSLPANATELEKEIAIAKAYTGYNKTVQVECRFETNPLRAKFTITGIKNRSLTHLTHYLRIKMVKFMAEMKMTPGLNIKEEDSHEFEAVNYPEPPLVQESIMQDASNEPDKPEDFAQQSPKNEKILSEEEGEVLDDDDDDELEEEEEDVPDNFFDDFAKEDFLDGLDDLVGYAEEDVSKVNSDSGIKSCDRSSSRDCMSLERQRSESSGSCRDGSVTKTDFSLARKRSRTISRSRSRSANNRSRLVNKRSGSANRRSRSANRRSRSANRRSRSANRRSRSANRRYRSANRRSRSANRRSRSANRRSRSVNRRPRSHDKWSRRDYRSRRREKSRRRRSRTRSRSRDRWNRRYGRKRRRSGSSHSRSPSRSRKPRFSSPPKRVLDEAKKQAFFQEIRDRINGVIPAVAPIPVPVVLEQIPRPVVLEQTPRPTVLEQIPRPVVLEQIPIPVALEQIPRPRGLEQTPRPMVLEQIPRPVVLEQIPRPTVLEQIPRPVVLEQIPIPVALEQIPRPRGLEQTPRPMVLEQIPRPVVLEQIPRPTVLEQIPRPVVLEQIPRPVVLEQIPRPVVLEQTPRPVVQEQIPRPVVLQQIPSPVVLQQVSICPVSTQHYRKRFFTDTPTARGFSKNKKVPDDDPLHKLFADKKISFQDYVTILTKRQGKPSLTREQLQKKEQVIERCELFLQSGMMGAFRVQPSPQPKPKEHPSPIQKSKAKFKFTSSTKESEESDFSKTLHRMLRRVGIFSETYQNERFIESVAEALSSGADLDSNLAAQILEVSLLGSKTSSHCVAKRVIDVGTQTRTPQRNCDKKLVRKRAR